jgi:two-component system, sensor histidine kinase and response regulator
VNEPGPDAPLLLVVDDNPLNVEPLCDLLETIGYRVVSALDGQTALRLVPEVGPDLILLDIMMPGMDGIEVCRRLRAEPDSAKIPIVFVTALSETEDKVRALEAGGDDFLTKPFNRPILLARIRSLLRLKSANDELEESYRKLKAMERMKDDLMKMIVHDLKSPLSSMLATLEMSAEGDLGPVTDEHSRLLSDAQRCGADMLQLIDDLLELTRLEHEAMSVGRHVVALPGFFGEIAEEWGVRVERRGATFAADAPSHLVAYADARLLRRVLSNLIGNALKHAGHGVTIRLSAHDAGEDGVHFTVADDGVGIAPAHAERIFQKFATLAADPAVKRSTGLGLSFCKLAVEAHGGRIWVDSQEGSGSAFHFVLPPLAPDASIALAPAGAA